MSCGKCEHWKPPAASDVRRWEDFQAGRTRRRARKPSGYCVNVHDPRHPGVPVCQARYADQDPCANFKVKAEPG